jgi:hypothetical protein
VIAGCGAATPITARDTTPHDVATTSESTQRFEVAIGQSVVVDGETLTLSGWTEREREGAPFGVTLRRDDPEGDGLDVWSPGCTREGAWVWTLEALDTGEPGGARLTRRRASEDTRGMTWGEPIEVSPGQTLAASDGWRFTLHSVRAYGPEVLVWILEMVAEHGDERLEQRIDAQPEHAHEQTLTGDHVVTAWTTSTRDPWGCPVVRLAITNPSAIVVSAREGEEVEIRTHARASVGGAFIRYGGWGEMIGADGESWAIADIQVQAADGTTASQMCEVGRDDELAGWMIRVTRAGQSSARLIARRAGPE